MSNKTFKTYVDKMGGTAANTYIGTEGELFYDPTTTTLRVSNGTTAGGTIVSGGGGADLGDLVIYNGAITTDGVSTIYIAPNGEGYGYIAVPNDASAANGAATVIGNSRNDGGGVQIISYNKTWTFGTNGSLTVPSNGIITAPNAQEFQLQAKDTNSLLRNEINLDPNNGTYMSVWSEELSTSFSTSDWATASWANIEGVPGISGGFFTNAENLQDFWTTGIGSFVDSVEVSINGGARRSVEYDGTNGEQYGVLLLVTGVPATSPTTITSLIFYYRTKNKINIDYANGVMRLDAQSMDTYVETTDTLEIRAGENLNLRGLGSFPVRIYTDTETHVWEFDSAGALTLPSEGKIYGLGLGPGGDRYGYISWSGNTSGDGQGYNTMRLVPDQQGLEAADQYIIIDPTSGEPGHIHIRAGGTQDNSGANLYLGGENSHVKISAGLNPPVTVMANNNSWIFGTNGSLTFPNSSVQTGGAISITELKALVANSATYAAFQSAIANL